MAVTDLTNTKWLINSTTCTAGYGQFSVNHTCTPDYQGSTIFIGYDLDRTTPVATANSVLLMGSLHTLEVNDILTIESGTDVTNSNLISWLTANATQIATGGSMYLGTSSISKMYIGQDEVEKIYLGQDLVYEKQASLSMFIGTDEGSNVYGPYEFENGMTFAQWVASAYNTAGWVVSANNKIVLDGYKYLRKGSFTDVVSTDVVEAIDYFVYLDN